MWRLKWHSSPEHKGVLLCAAMHNQFVVLHYGDNDTFSASQQVVHKGGHESLGYGADWLPGTTVAGSASFYDHRLEFWQLDRELRAVV